MAGGLGDLPPITGHFNYTLLSHDLPSSVQHEATIGVYLYTSVPYGKICPCWATPIPNDGSLISMLSIKGR